jgi:hypothetical protein
MRAHPQIITLALIAILLTAPACGSSDAQGSDTTDIVAADAAGEDASPQDVAGDASTEPPEVDPQDGDEPEVQEPAVEDFVFLKAPYLVRVHAEGVTVTWHADRPIELPWVRLTDEESGEERFVMGAAAPFDMSLGSLPLAPPEGVLARVPVDGLAPGVRYRYRVESAEQVYEGSLRAAPSRGEPYRFVAFGDNRTNHDDHQRVVSAIVEEAPDLVVNTGDLVDVSSPEAWQLFFDVEADLLRSTPIEATLGNHESEVTRALFLEFVHPEPGFEDGTNTSGAFGDVYLILTSCLRDVEREGYLAWFEAELEAAEAYPYRFVVSHCPMLTYSNHGPWHAGLELLHPLMAAHGVTAFLSGHNHCYEHFELDGVHHFTLGGGGAPLYGVPEASPDPDDQSFVMAKKVFHYMRVDVTDEAATAVIQVVEGDGQVTPLETIVFEASP